MRVFKMRIDPEDADARLEARSWMRFEGVSGVACVNALCVCLRGVSKARSMLRLRLCCESGED